MQNERETKKIITPVGQQEIVVRTYITGREKRALANVYLQGKVDFSIEENKLKDFDFTLADKVQDLAWQTVIVSIDGRTDDIVNRILDMRGQDYDFVVSEVNKITADKDFDEEKKTS